MLTHLARGNRHYYHKPYPEMVRHIWEIEVVVSGSCGPSFAKSSRIIESKHLWCLPPDSCHGWIGERDDSANILVFHFENLPKPLEVACRNQGFLSLKLNNDEISFVKLCYDKLLPGFQRPDTLNLIKGEIGKLELCHFILQRLEIPKLDSSADYAGRIVNNAIRWFIARMEDNVGVSEVAKALNISESHLRFLFHKVKGLSPQKVFTRKKLEEVKRMLETSSYSITDIAMFCGFTEASVLSRAFRNCYNTTPREYRDLYLVKSRVQNSAE